MHARHILVTVSGTAVDHEVLDLACLVAKKTRAKITALYVIRVARTLPLDAEIPGDTEAGENVLEQAERIASSAGVKIETDLLQSRELGSAIVDEAVERSADLIVMGMMKERIFGEVEFGETAKFVLVNAPCRVWLCRASNSQQT